QAPGVLSALGMLIADTLKDYVRTVMVPVEKAEEIVASSIAELETQGRGDLAQEGIAEEKISIERYLDLRYVGQSYELTIPFEDDVMQAANDFHAAHERRFGYSDPNERVQVVNVRLKARGLTTHPELEVQEVVRGVVAESTITRNVVFAGKDGPV